MQAMTDARGELILRRLRWHAFMQMSRPQVPMARCRFRSTSEVSLNYGLRRLEQRNLPSSVVRSLRKLMRAAVCVKRGTIVDNDRPFDA